MKKWIWNICFGLALISFTVYMALDTFVLSQSYEVVSDANTSLFESNESENTNVVSSSDTSYQDDNVSITVSTYTYEETQVYVADIQFNSVESIQTALANDTYGKNVTETTSSIASSHNAILAINGDYYGARESGYVIRNGVVYRDTINNDEVCCIYADGTMKIVNANDYTAQELVDAGVWQAFDFGPGLVEDGQISVSESDEVGKAKTSNPRTAIGMIDTNHYVFVVSDGRTDESKGLSLYQLAIFMQSLGVSQAYNLDGGGSSTMYFNGEVINNPTTNGAIEERKVSDIIYVS